MQGKNRELTVSCERRPQNAGIAAHTLMRVGRLAIFLLGMHGKNHTHMGVCVCVCVAAVKDPDNLARRVSDAAAAVTSTTFLEENLAWTGPAWGEGLIDPVWRNAHARV